MVINITFSVLVYLKGKNIPGVNIVILVKKLLYIDTGISLWDREHWYISRLYNACQGAAKAARTLKVARQELRVTTMCAGRWPQWPGTASQTWSGQAEQKCWQQQILTTVRRPSDKNKVTGLRSIQEIQTVIQDQDWVQVYLHNSSSHDWMLRPELTGSCSRGCGWKPVVEVPQVLKLVLETLLLIYPNISLTYYNCE